MKFSINPGEFKHPITIESKGKGVKNEDGIMEYPEPLILLSTRAKILNIKGSEFIQALADSAKITKKFYIRYNPKVVINETHTIDFKGSKYNILYPNNIEEANRYLEIIGVCVKNG